MTPNLVVAFGMGVALAVYLPVLGQSGRILGSPIFANVPFFAIATVTSLVLAFASGLRPADAARLGTVPPWMFLAGVVSALMILGSAYLIPRIGPGPFFVLLVAGQILMGALLSHQGWLGAAADPITLRKGLGLSLVLAGAVLATLR